jgi:hypothetical protein
VTAPEMVRIVRQDGELPDCAVASLAMLCGVGYGQALAAFPKPHRVLKAGAYLTELQAAAKALGIKTKIRKRFDLEEDTGILHVSGKDEHLVFLWAGRIIEGNGECWLSSLSYLTTYDYEPKSLVMAVE